MKSIYAVVLAALVALPSIVMAATCRNCGFSSSFCLCREVRVIDQLLGRCPQDSGQRPTHFLPSDVEEDGVVQITTSRGTFTIGDESSDTDPSIFYNGHNLFFSSTPQAAPPRYLLNSFSMQGGSQHYLSMPIPPRNHRQAESGYNPIFEQSRAGFEENRYQPASTVRRTLFSEHDQNYSVMHWEAMHYRFKAALQNLRASNERNELRDEVIEEVKNSLRNSNGLEGNGLMANIFRDPSVVSAVTNVYLSDMGLNEDDLPSSQREAADLMHEFQRNIPRTMASIARRGDLTTLVAPAEITLPLEWISGNFEPVYNSLLTALPQQGNHNTADFLRHVGQIRELVRQLARDSTPSFFTISDSSGTPGLQEISDMLVDHINTELQNGARSFAFRYAGTPSPYNHGSLFLFIVQDAAIIISPHFGVLMSRNLDDAVTYIIDFTLALAVNKISDKVYVRSNQDRGRVIR